MHWESLYGGPTILSGIFGITAGILFIIVCLWSIIWKGMSLWKSAREGSKIWFVVLLLVNTVGILDILYIYVFSKKFKKVS
jgi:uncharacterized membrane protein YagU involved in acid resistance